MFEFQTLSIIVVHSLQLPQCLRAFNAVHIIIIIILFYLSDVFIVNAKEFFLVNDELTLYLSEVMKNLLAGNVRGVLTIIPNI